MCHMCIGLNSVAPCCLVAAHPLQVRALEAQLSQLRGQAAEVEDKRLRLQQRQAAALEALSATTGRKMSVRRPAV